MDRRHLIKGTAAAALAAASPRLYADEKPKEMQFYHDFSILGLSVPQMPGFYIANQKNKEPLVTGYMLYALGKLKGEGRSPVTVGELFCADAYYSFIARRFGADRCDAFDNDRDGYLWQTHELAKMLGENEVHIHKTDMFAMPPDFRASIMVNVGGLYHVADPMQALDISYSEAKDYLVVQTVVSLANENPDYFETPAPGWTWGSRFSFAYIERQIKQRGWKIVDSDRNVLEGNDRPEDRGSAYFLISRS